MDIQIFIAASYAILIYSNLVFNNKIKGLCGSDFLILTFSLF